MRSKKTGPLDVEPGYVRECFSDGIKRALIGWNAGDAATATCVRGWLNEHGLATLYRDWTQDCCSVRLLNRRVPPPLVTIKAMRTPIVATPTTTSGTATNQRLTALSILASW